MPKQRVVFREVLPEFTAVSSIRGDRHKAVSWLIFDRDDILKGELVHWHTLGDKWSWFPLPPERGTTGTLDECLTMIRKLAQ